MFYHLYHTKLFTQGKVNLPSSSKSFRIIHQWRLAAKKDGNQECLSPALFSNKKRQKSAHAAAFTRSWKVPPPTEPVFCQRNSLYNIRPVAITFWPSNRPYLSGASECHLVYIHVLRDGSTCGGTITRDDIDNTGWESSLQIKARSCTGMTFLGVTEWPRHRGSDHHWPTQACAGRFR